MGKRETHMTLWYSQQVGGTLIEEFLVVSRSEGQGQRLIDGLIILGGKKRRLPVSAKVDLTGKDVIVVQTKNGRLGMGLMGQAVFSAKLVRKYFKPRSVRSVALCSKSDSALQPLLEAFKGCEVVVHQ